MERGGCWGLSRGTWFGCSKHSSSLQPVAAPGCCSERRWLVAGVHGRRGRRPRTNSAGGGWLIFLGQRIMKPPRKRREREKSTDRHRPRPIPGLPGEHPVAGASQPATLLPEGAFQKEPSGSSGFRYAPSNDDPLA